MPTTACRPGWYDLKTGYPDVPGKTSSVKFEDKPSIIKVEDDLNGSIEFISAIIREASAKIPGQSVVKSGFIPETVKTTSMLLSTDSPERFSTSLISYDAKSYNDAYAKFMADLMATPMDKVLSSSTATDGTLNYTYGTYNYTYEKEVRVTYIDYATKSPVVRTNRVSVTEVRTGYFDPATGLAAPEGWEPKAPSFTDYVSPSNGFKTSPSSGTYYAGGSFHYSPSSISFSVPTSFSTSFASSTLGGSFVSVSY